MGLNELIKIGDNIRKLRLEAGKSQKKVAEELGIPYSTYSNYENNNRVPSASITSEIAKYFNVSINNLLQGAPEFWEAKLTDDETELIADYNRLNVSGKKEAKKRVNELTKLEEYCDTDSAVVFETVQPSTDEQSDS